MASGVRAPRRIPACHRTGIPRPIPSGRLAADGRRHIGGRSGHGRRSARTADRRRFPGRHARRIRFPRRIAPPRRAPAAGGQPRRIRADVPRIISGIPVRSGENTHGGAAGTPRTGRRAAGRLPHAARRARQPFHRQRRTIRRGAAGPAGENAEDRGRMAARTIAGIGRAARRRQRGDRAVPFGGRRTRRRGVEDQNRASAQSPRVERHRADRARQRHRARLRRTIALRRRAGTLFQRDPAAEGRTVRAGIVRADRIGRIEGTDDHGFLDGPARGRRIHSFACRVDHEFAAGHHRRRSMA